MRFSQRIGKKPVKNVLQIDSMDDDLKNSLWNVVYINIVSLDKSTSVARSPYESLYEHLWFGFFKLPLDNLYDDLRFTSAVHAKIKDLFYSASYLYVYDFVEFVAQNVDNKEFIPLCNAVMERELSGYRFVGNKITTITNENELKAIEEAIGSTQKTKLSGVNKHLESALAKFSDRKNPDYRNSVKESISAVESACKIISGKDKATLSEALNALGGKVEIHGALKKGFDSIYGYTSDEGGIRHAMLEDPKVDFEDAKYMLVSCCAFINYLLGKAAKAGIKF